MSGRVGSVISKSGMVENVGVAVGIASPCVSVKKLFPLPVYTVSWPTYEFRLSTSSACKGDVGVPMWMKYCHAHAQIHEVPVENSDIPSLWNWTHFSAYLRSGRIPFPVTQYDIVMSLLLHFMWNWML